jgi:16S rRNA (guanine1516-N2)-methyltransferase
VEYKRKHGEMHKSPLIRSVSVADKPKSEVRFVDATGGLGADGFMMAAMGFQVTIVERNPIMYTLLYDAFKVAEQVRQIFLTFLSFF